MELLKIGLAIALALFLLDQLGLWLERRGWLYWRHRKPSGGGLGPALEELNAFMNPSIRHVIEEKEKESKPKDDQGDDPHRENDSMSKTSQ